MSRIGANTASCRRRACSSRGRRRAGSRRRSARCRFSPAGVVRLGRLRSARAPRRARWSARCRCDTDRMPARAQRRRLLAALVDDALEGGLGGLICATWRRTLHIACYHARIWLGSRPARPGRSPASRGSLTEPRPGAAAPAADPCAKAEAKGRSPGSRTTTRSALACATREEGPARPRSVGAVVSHVPRRCRRRCSPTVVRRGRRPSSCSPRSTPIARSTPTRSASSRRRRGRRST